MKTDKRTKYFKHLQILTAFSLGVIVCGIGNQVISVYAQDQEIISPLPDRPYAVWTITKEITVDNTDTLIGKYADKYDVDRYLLHCIIKYESRYNKNAKNSKSTASGLGQFLTSTWIGWRKQMNENIDPDLRFNEEEAIKTIAWALSKGYKYHWEVVNNGYCY